jgi:hypothetical protein
MAERAFETDFWKHANLRKVWDDIVPGEPRQTIPYTLTRQAIELYCQSVGELFSMKLTRGPPVMAG